MAKKQISNLNFIDEIDRRFNDLLVTYEGDDINVIPTGSVSLDVSLGIGGIPQGRFTEIYGNEGSGKTTLALSIAKNAIENGLKVLYCDPEQGLDMGRAVELMGTVALDKDWFVHVQPEFLEDALAICELAVSSKEFGLVILDSIASMSSKIVKEKGLDDVTMALLPRKYGVFLSRNSYQVRMNNVAFIGINQVRDKFGAFMPTYETPGGHQWKHVCSVRIMLSKATDITRGGEKAGVMVKFVVKKNKLAPPFRTFSFPLMFDKGVDYYTDLFDFADTMGLFQKRGAHYVFQGEVLGNGVANSIAKLKEDKEALDKLKELCYNITKDKMILEETDEEYYEQESED